MATVVTTLIEAAKKLSHDVDRLRFLPPVTHIYNPLNYAWAAHEAYLRSFSASRKRIVFLGMNPGPFGMVQTGVPFGEVASVRDWMGIRGPIVPPRRVHPRRPIEGFECARSEVSGQRLWGLFAARFGRAEDFFAEHFVINYCPLAFLDEGGRNLTPDKLLARETTALFAACDEHLRHVVAALRPGWLIGVGEFAEKRARLVLGDAPLKIGKVLHPSPASPAANRAWATKATAQLKALGVWQ